LHTTESGQHNQNHAAAELEIMHLGKRLQLQMDRKQVPVRLWDFGLVHEGALLTHILQGCDSRTRYEEVTGNTPDISEWLDFEFYDIV
jgi:hypothetical protein